jgi:tetratricopeptide (TPR) repeat protein
MTTDDQFLYLAEEFGPLLKAGRYQEYIDAIDKFIIHCKEPSILITCYLGLANAWLELGNVERAKLAMSMLDSLSPDDCIFIAKIRARVQQADGRLIDSQITLQKILDDENIKLWTGHMELCEVLELMGLALAGMNEFSRAATYFRQSYDCILNCTCNGDDRELFANNVALGLSRCLIETCEYPEAEQILNRIVAVASGATLSDAYYFLGTIKLREKRLAGALQDLYMSLENSLDDFERSHIVLLALRDAHRENRDYELADEFDRRAKASVLTQ